MIVRRYTGSSMARVREVILRELGPDAVIVSSAKRRKGRGIPGLSGHVYEATAVAEEAIDTESRPAPDAPGDDWEPFIEMQHRQYRGLRKSMKLLDEKLADVDELMGNMAMKIVEHDGPRLLENVHRDWHGELTKRARNLSSEGKPADENWLEALATMIRAEPGLDFDSRQKSGDPLVCVIAGPTGVGKTTTLAKLAAKCVLGKKLRVALITLDTFRLAGVQQLREYASLLGIQLAVAFSPAETEKQLERFQDMDAILIDTPGRGQFDAVGIQDIRTKLGDCPNFITLLTVPAGVRKQDAETICESYRILNPGGLVITKTDEASCCDGVTRLLEVTGLPALYLTDGQRVPEDLHEATPRLVASLVMSWDKIKKSESETVEEKI